MNRTNNFFIILSIITLLLLILIPHLSKKPDILLFKDDLYEYNTGWMMNGKKILMPNKFEAKTNERLIIKNTLPTTIRSGDNIITRAYMQAVEVKVENEVIYDTSLGSNGNVGVYWVVAPLSERHAGREVEVAYYSSNKFLHGTMSDFFIGSEGGLFKKLICG